MNKSLANVVAVILVAIWIATAVGALVFVLAPQEFFLKERTFWDDALYFGLGGLFLLNPALFLFGEALGKNFNTLPQLITDIAYLVIVAAVLSIVFLLMAGNIEEKFYLFCLMVLAAPLMFMFGVKAGWRFQPRDHSEPVHE